MIPLPASVPGDHTAPKHYQSPPRRRGSWHAVRVGETVGEQHSEGPLGTQGPDQGYALKLARRFEGRLVLSGREHTADVLAGIGALALRRASLYARAPVAEDTEVALTVWGYLSEASDELAQLRRPLFAELHHGPHSYRRVRAVVAEVPDATLRMSAEAVGEVHRSDWRALLGL